MTYSWADLSDVLEQRALRLGIPDDSATLLLAAYHALHQIVDTYDIPAYMVLNTAIAQTQAGLTRYPLPDDFGRLWHVHDERAPGQGGTGQSGLFISDNAATPTLAVLSYKDPIRFLMERQTQNSKPAVFTRSGRDFLLDPPPDANNNNQYTIQGVYVSRIERPELALDEPILIDEPSTLVAMTLHQVAQDRGLPQAAMLEKEKLQLLSALVNNVHRAKQQFYTSRWPRTTTR